MQSATPQAEGAGTIRIDSTDAHFEGFSECDPHVVSLLRSTADPEHTAHVCLQIGARALDSASPALDSAEVQRSFGAMADRLADQLEGFGGELAKLAAEDGPLAARLASFRAQLEEELNRAFDPDVRVSVMGRFEHVLAAHRQAQQEALTAAVDSSDESSPLGRQRVELLRAVRTESEHVRATVGELAERVAVAKAKEEVMERTAVKGDAYEEVVHAALGALTAPTGDLAERTGTSAGSTGGRIGDEVITLNPEDTPGATGLYVIEAKDRRLPMRGCLEELQAALRNREAQAAIAVFSRPGARADVRPVCVLGRLRDRRVRQAEPRRHRPASRDHVGALGRAAQGHRRGRPARRQRRARIDRRGRARPGADNGRARAQSAAIRKIEEAGAHTDALTEEVTTAMRSRQWLVRRRSLTGRSLRSFGHTGSCGSGGPARLRSRTDTSIRRGALRLAARKTSA